MPLAAQAASLFELDFEAGSPSPANGATAVGTTPSVLATGLSLTLSLSLSLSLSDIDYQTNGGFFNGNFGADHVNAIRANGLVTDTSMFTTVGTSGQTIIYESFAGLFSSSSGDITIDLSYSIGGGGSTVAGSTFNPADGSPFDASGSAFDFTDFSTDQSVVWTLTFTALNDSNDRMRFDDLVMIGTVPELGSYALLAGLTGLIFVMLRRRR